MTLSIKRIAAMLAASLILAGVVAGTASVFTIRATTRVAATWTDFERHAAAKSDLIAELREALGYGGMIHQFKNMVLRRDMQRIGAVRSKAKAATQALKNYRAIGVDAEEEQSLRAIGSVIESYESSTDMAERMIPAGSTTAEIDQIVKIDDGPALAALAKLDEHLRKLRRASAADMSRPWTTFRRPSSAPPSSPGSCSPGQSSSSFISCSPVSCGRWPGLAKR